jgi:hypothetical protein
MKKLLLFISFISISLFYVSCTKEDTQEPDPTTGLTKLTEGFAAGAATKVEIYTKETIIKSGYTKFYMALYDSVSGKRIDEAHIKLTPMMDMGTMKHSAPYENPESENAVNHLYPCSVVFIMSSLGGNWTMKISVHNHESDKEGDLTIPVTVTEPAFSRMKSFTGLNDGNKYFVALIEPSSPKIGINNMEMAIYKKATMMSFPADSSLSVILTPEMPTMGHGSPNNINPTHTKLGHYSGKVNFTMTGFWRLNLDYKSGAAIADSTQYFDIEF